MSDQALLTLLGWALGAEIALFNLLLWRWLRRERARLVERRRQSLVDQLEANDVRLWEELRK